MNSTVTIHGTRRSRTTAAMTEAGVDLLLVSPGPDIFYLQGYQGHASERPVLLALAADRVPSLLVSTMEAPAVVPRDGIALITYDEVEDPIESLKNGLDLARPPKHIAVSDQAWATLLLRLQATFWESTFSPASPILRDCRMRKSEEELDLLSRAGAAVDAVFVELTNQGFAGQTEKSIAERINQLVRQHGLERAGWGPIVASGPNSAAPHHLTGDRVIESGDCVVLDYGGTLHGYQADTTRTVHVGEPAARFVHVYEVVLLAQQAGVDAGGRGVPAKAVDAAARAVIEAAGFGAAFVHRTGHGLGIDVHEDPYIVAGNDLRLDAGMVYSVEPGIYLTGEFGIRIEDIVAIAGTGVTRLNNAERTLVIVS